jgi:hypothetical protein
MVFLTCLAFKIRIERYFRQDVQQLASRIAKLSSAQQGTVEKFVQKLESSSASRQLTVDQVIDEFEREHPELLRLLAQ